MSIEVVLVKTRYGTTEVYVDQSDLLTGKCRGCGASIIWGTTKNGKNFPISRVLNENIYEYISHFADCPKANEFRK
jgi:Fe-S cluster biogenesis protein NfuA